MKTKTNQSQTDINSEGVANLSKSDEPINKQITEIEKGCGNRVFCEHHRDSLKCGTIWSGDLHLCSYCYGKLDGFKAGQLSAMKEELKFLEQITKTEAIKFEIEELKKQIGEMER